jgi:hypothetical protein
MRATPESVEEANHAADEVLSSGLLAPEEKSTSRQQLLRAPFLVLAVG